MSIHSRRTSVRETETPSDKYSSMGSMSYSHGSRGSASRTYSEKESRSGSRRILSEATGNRMSGVSRQSRSSVAGPLELASPRDFPLPRSVRKIPLPPAQPGSRLVVTISGPEKLPASRNSRLGDSSPGYTKRTTETFVFSPRDEMARGFGERSRPSQVSRRSYRSGRPEERALVLARPPRKSATFPPTRISLGPRTKSANRTSYTSNGPRSAVRTSTSRDIDSPTPEPTLVDFGDTETLAPSDSISVVSEKAERRRRRSSGRSR